MEIRRSGGARSGRETAPLNAIKGDRKTRGQLYLLRHCHSQLATTTAGLPPPPPPHSPIAIIIATVNASPTVGSPPSSPTPPPARHLASTPKPRVVFAGRSPHRRDNLCFTFHVFFVVNKVYFLTINFTPGRKSTIWDQFGSQSVS